MVGFFRYTIIFLCFLLSTRVALAVEITDAALSEKYMQDIARVEAYLKQLTTIKAHFEQVAPDGGLAEGKFYLKRPGKMRWEYAPPTPILLVSNGETITYFDAELDQVNFVSLDDTIAGFLTKDELKLNTDATRLKAFEVTPGAIRATIEQRERPENGHLTLEFADAPLTLKQLVITDAAGNETHIALNTPQYGVELDDSLFIFKDPRGVIKHKFR